MQVTLESASDVAYVTLVDTIAPGEAERQVEVVLDTGAADLILDLDKDGRLLGIELLQASRQLRPELLEIAIVDGDDTGSGPAQ